MASQFRARKRSSPAVRLAILAGVVVAVRHLMAPAYSVGGSWEGSLADLKTLPKGLDHPYVQGFQFTGDDGLNFTVEDGHLTAAWARGPVSVSANDAHEWQFNFTGHEGSLVSHGKGADELEWEASRRHSVEGFGDVEVHMTSGRELIVDVAPTLPEVAGVSLAAHARSDGAGLQGHLEALRQLAEGVDVKYRVENSAGDYGLANLQHNARVDASLGGGKATVEVGYDGDAPSYNASYAKDLEALLKGASEAVLGVDNDGAYGAVAASRGVGAGLAADYRLSGRMALESNTSDPEFAQSLQLSHDLGHVKLAQASGEPIGIEAAVHVAQGPAAVDTTVSYDLDAKTPTYNVTLSGDLVDLAAGQLGSAEVQLGMDSEGPYGSVAASRDLGFDGLTAEYSTSGRLDALEHALKVSNNWGHAKLVKSGDADPRLQLGYELEV